ncbi:MAG: hypothetical protein FWB86_06220 [Treponema sp.]|nr:hypothetical protein [Treponema sp.]MCL2250773.1 hypothetical protein [Treponema sp.]
MINSDTFRKPQIIFLIYAIAGSLLIILFRFIFPGAEAPLLIYSRDWRFLQGLLEVFNFFPALALSALVIPFGLAAYEEQYQSFSEIFFKWIAPSVIVAIIAAAVYVIIFFFAFPTVKDKEENYRFSGELYHLAKNKANEHAQAGEWYRTSQFIDICDVIWYKSEEMQKLRDMAAIKLEEELFEDIDEKYLARSALAESHRDPEIVALYEKETPIDATEAITMSRKAFEDKRYFDAHWLANLGMRLAPNGSAQEANAARIASDAWNMITAQAPTHREEKLFNYFNLKIAGYRAMNSDKWIEAYYIFKNLITQTPDDPDVVNFLAVSEQNAAKTAFFIDEMNYSLGQILNGALFSLPNGNGRVVMRFATITTSADAAYGMGFEYMRFDADNKPQESIISSYAKMTPITVDGKPQVLVLTHALDREHEEKGNAGEWLLGRRQAGGILLDVSYEDFLLISHVRRGLSILQIDELYNVSRKLSSTGYVSQVFQAEILNRLGTVLFFLPMAIFIIVIAWRYRAVKKPRYIFVIMLPVLPIVFHGFVFLYRSVFNTLGIWLVISFGFFPAVIAYVVALGVLLFVSLISLSAQHG